MKSILSPSGTGHLHLPQVTLCAATSVNVTATVRALQASMRDIRFGACKLFTDATIAHPDPAIEVVPVAPIRSSAAYSQFMLTQLATHIATSHCLVVQWDGHVTNAALWQPAFLDYDYIGAIWPQFSDGHDVGNGGFSLRSKRLLDACALPEFEQAHPEDVAIGRVNRAWLENCGLRFAEPEIANRFSTERTGDLDVSFGYHGVFNMPRALGPATFWDIYRVLDDRGTLHHDYWRILADVARGKGGIARAMTMLKDKVWAMLRIPHAPATGSGGNRTQVSCKKAD